MSDDKIRSRPRDEPQHSDAERELIADALDAEELFDLDELEDFARRRSDAKA